MFLNQTKVLPSLLLSLSIVSSSLSAASDHDELVNSIVKLRGDVEGLYTQIKENKQRYSDEMKSLSMQITDTEAQINRKETSIKLAKGKLQEIRTKIKETSSTNTEIKPLITEAITLLEGSIKEGIPFMVDHRIAELHKIKSDLDENLITAEKALALVWASYDDAIRVTKEIGLFKQEITLKGKNTLAKIAKIGSVALFFSTPTDELGYAIKTDNGYEYKLVTDPKDKEKIVALFDALQKQIRTGFFELPNAFILQGSN
ncbi:DUF3450 family protein [Sulfurimonas marina]|uniref:DUF3450 domain-containing protein n=1 Tax=Sulfurimonas marina TaxID=2590551 RepID=A0A7M1AX53_9BACT|nr:DUF3450 family protein [Sulfurimonas marina]QOP41995.1 DUF3450 domain-containing protein [Sulfurimonas marina]